MELSHFTQAQMTNLFLRDAIVSNLVWPEFTLMQDLVELGTAYMEQARMPSGDAVPAHVSDQ